MRILYVEDNPANVFLVKRVAKMGNHEIINYIDGGEALKKFPEINPDLILMDVQLAGELNGLDVVRRLRADGVTTPIVAVTAYAMVGDRERCIEAGCNDYLAKPLPIPRLLEIFTEYGPGGTSAVAKPAPKTEKPAAAQPVSTDTPTESTTKSSESTAEAAQETTSASDATGASTATETTSASGATDASTTTETTSATPPATETNTVADTSTATETTSATPAAASTEVSTTTDTSDTAKTTDSADNTSADDSNSSVADDSSQSSQTEVKPSN